MKGDPVVTIRRRVAERTCSRWEWQLLDSYDRRAELIELLQAQQLVAPSTMRYATHVAVWTTAMRPAVRALQRRLAGVHDALKRAGVFELVKGGTS